MFCSGWLARANAGNSNPSLEYLEQCCPVLARDETKRTQHKYRIAAMLEA